MSFFFFQETNLFFLCFPIFGLNLVYCIHFCAFPIYIPRHLTGSVSQFIPLKLQFFGLYLLLPNQIPSVLDLFNFGPATFVNCDIVSNTLGSFRITWKK